MSTEPRIIGKFPARITASPEEENENLGIRCERLEFTK
jgi:hypothetical protein